MDTNYDIVAPHRNADVYRSDGMNTNTMSYLDYIYIDTDGTVLIGCSELSGRYWNGGACVFSSIQDVTEKHTQDSISVHLPSSTADGCFLGGSNKLLLCEDSGTIGIWKCSEGAWSQWTKVIAVSEHNDIVMSVDCLEPDKTYVIVGADTNIKIWNISHMTCTHNYLSAHDMMISDVAVKPDSTTNFATTSYDRMVSVWDSNIKKSVLDAEISDCGVRCVKWITEHELIIGNEAGVLASLDIRNPCIPNRIANLPAPIHRLLVKQNSQHVVVCCDNKTVSVYNFHEDNPKLIYQNRQMHSNYVRGLAWDCKDENLLHTVGWDGTVKTHKYL